ncbi:MAG: hypothetical protein K5662_02595 [Lachnospiraceae bacterium]|nr:hypothetical protein [Lachnospiraceae bacterium]
MFEKYNIDSGIGLKRFLEDAGLQIERVSGIEGSQNVIHIKGFTTFNWKSREKLVRINCKEPTKNLIESKTDLKHFDNGKGDFKTHPFSFFVDTLSDLVDVVYILKKYL